MPGLIDSATAILVSAEKRAQSSGQDIANASTSGYKQQVDFAGLLQANASDQSNLPKMSFTRDFSQGQLIETENPLDLAISGSALMALRDGDAIIFGRGGSFSLGEDGILSDSAGYVLQDSRGGDLVLTSDAAEFLPDGTVLEDGLPVGSIALVDVPRDGQMRALGGSVFDGDLTSMLPADGSTLRQGFLEKSNVVLSDEMITMMTAVRQAETGARITQFYDQLIGQAITTFSRGAR